MATNLFLRIIMSNNFKIIEGIQVYNISVDGRTGEVRVGTRVGDRTDTWTFDANLLPKTHSYDIEPYDGWGLSHYTSQDGLVISHGSSRPEGGAYILMQGNMPPVQKSSSTSPISEWLSSKYGAGAKFLRAFEFVQLAAEKYPLFPLEVADKIPQALDQMGVVGAGSLRSA
jgi:hypothetical protein